MAKPLPGSAWWERPGLEYANDQLQFEGLPVEGLFLLHGSPTFLYSAARLRDNIVRLTNALDANGFAGRHRLHYAMKANRFAPLLTFLKQTGSIGIDACSPNEVEHALSCGFRPEEVSFTATSLSRRDIERLAAMKDVRINLDSISAMQSWAQAGGRQDIGLRINPGLGISRDQNDKLAYSGEATSKFGIYLEQFPLALETASRLGLKISRLHFHSGCGFLSSQLNRLEEILKASLDFISLVPDLESVNIGGGLGVPHLASDLQDGSGLDLDAWARTISRVYGAQAIKLELEPGEYIAKDSGILLLEVTHVEEKRSTLFAGVDAGFNIALEPAVYGLPFEPVPAVRRSDRPHSRYSIAGNINEALDVFYRNKDLPQLEAGDCLVLINAGAYSSSMASNHCMRGDFREVLII